VAAEELAGRAQIAHTASRTGRRNEGNFKLSLLDDRLLYRGRRG
jgi:hypothetical protein